MWAAKSEELSAGSTELWMAEQKAVLWAVMMVVLLVRKSVVQTVETKVAKKGPKMAAQKDAKKVDPMAAN